MFSLLKKLQGRDNTKMRKKWRMFHATDFESLMCPSFIFCHILGIFPYKINASAFEISKPHYIFSTVVTCVCFISLLRILYLIDICGITRFNGIPRALERNCFYILSGFIMVITYILSGPRMRLLQTIMEISSKLPPESYQELSRLIHAKDVLGSFLLVVQLMIYFQVNVHIILKIFLLYVYLLMFHVDMLYINCVCVLKACFKRINDDLEYMQKLIMKDEVYHLDDRTKLKSIFLLIKLNALKKQHLIISNAVQMLNRTFSLQLLPTIILSFAEITFMLYYYILYWRDGTIMMDISAYFYKEILIMLTIYYLIKIMLIVWACETSKNQALQIGTTIHDMLNSTGDIKIKRELQLFSFQILHCENIFFAKGLTVNATLLTSMMGNISTYLLILMQFLNISHFCGRSSHVT